MRRVKGIAGEALEFILEASRSTMPREFAGLLQARDGVISEILILPGTDSSEWMAWVPMYMLPSMPVVGSCHSHPVPNPLPSQEDLEFFSHTGSYHIIAFPPFDERSWRCYDSSGRRRDLMVIRE
ncbi:MAG: Mov34/MPN/PAD-1 family protein [Methanothrix sp.]|jgi:proteasome lid subunit RPN8/RPN11|uniref:Mov34/MPN/PAD-1 family protein n=1 Tax=Methanothrix sp. TaxID=90426 RepID=UPI00247E9E5F|nr:Mov34/MPN/PAD-1 family protein [Methanothrix sp.]